MNTPSWLGRRGKAHLFALSISMALCFALFLYARDVLNTGAAEKEITFMNTIKSMVAQKTHAFEAWYLAATTSKIETSKRENTVFEDVCIGLREKMPELISCESCSPKNTEALVSDDDTIMSIREKDGKIIASVQTNIVDYVVEGIPKYIGIRFDITNLFHELEKMGNIMFRFGENGEILSRELNFKEISSTHPEYFIQFLVIICFIYIVSFLAFEKIHSFEGTLAKMQSLSQLLEQRDSYTYGHAQRVAKYSVDFAKCFGKSQQFLDDLKTSALCHDLGKILMPDNILLKEDALTDAEFEYIKRHPIYSYNMVSEILGRENIANIVRAHHERWDGKGYPDGISGKDIPEESRFIAIADVFDAMTTIRPYRDALRIADFIEYLKEGTGKHFDPEIVEKLLSLNVISQSYVDESEQKAKICANESALLHRKKKFPDRDNSCEDVPPKYA